MHMQLSWDTSDLLAQEITGDMKLDVFFIRFFILLPRDVRLLVYFAEILCGCLLLPCICCVHTFNNPRVVTAGEEKAKERSGTSEEAGRR